MLHFHDYLKENNDYQTNWPKIRLEVSAGRDVDGVHGSGSARGAVGAVR